ncbi:MAG: hypothetical protein IT449_16120 [Phycisphaerales bacterium]|nr:hypothetical protein [Phycisphaerales bacterium]
MKSSRVLWSLAGLGLATALAASVMAEDLGSAFTFQGRLKQDGSPLNASADFEFTLWDAASGGNPVGTVSPATSVNVVDGLFTVSIDFGVAAFDGKARWLETAVRSPAGGGSFVTLAPRQALTVAPYALQTRGLFVDDAGNLGVGNSAPTSRVDVTGVVTATGFSGDGSALSNLNASALAAGSIADARLSANVALLNAANTFTNAGNTSFVGNLGIGTTAPAAKLHVAGGDLRINRGTAVSGVTRSLVLGGARGSSTPAFASFQFENYDTNSGATDYTGAAIESFNSSGVDSGDLRFLTTPDLLTGPQERVRFDRNGNVGIGTTTPGFPLSFPDTLGDKISLYGQSGNHWGFGIQNGLLQIHSDTGAGDVAFGYGSSSSFTETMRVRGNGRVGVGLTNPAALLHSRTTTDGLSAVRGDGNAVAAVGVEGTTNDGAGIGVLGRATTTSGFNYGVNGRTASSDGVGVYGEATRTGAGSNTGVKGYARSADGYGVWGNADGANGIGVYGQGTDFGVFSQGDIAASGTKSFLIDHPLDPENKTLRHYCAEGPEPMNEYSGVVTLDRSGEAVVALPDYFESINSDFRYQLTCLGRFAPVYVAEEIRNNAFVIAGGEAGMRVSWEIKAVRSDLWVQTYGTPVEQEKSEQNRGKYIQPELYGLSPEDGLFYQVPREESVQDARRSSSETADADAQGNE